MVSGSGAKRAGPRSGARFESTIAAAPWVLSPPDRGYESPYSGDCSSSGFSDISSITVSSKVKMGSHFCILYFTLSS